MTAVVTGLISGLRHVALANQRLLVNRLYLHSTFSTSSSLRGLEEFFPPLTDNPSDLVEESEKAGQLAINKTGNVIMKLLPLLQVVHGRKTSLD